MFNLLLEITADQIDKYDTAFARIILAVHLRKEYSSVHRVIKEFFTKYEVQSFEELGISDQRYLKVLMDHEQKDKKVRFYMQCFPHIFNLCTLYDASSLISEFLGLSNYEEALLGPIHKHPAINRVFKFELMRGSDEILKLTSEDIVDAFLQFQASNRTRYFIYDDFLNHLVQIYGLEKPQQLGLFCKSFPYFTQVTRSLSYSYYRYETRLHSEITHRIIDQFEAKLREAQQEVTNQLELSSYNNKTPIEVAGHLLEIVAKYLNVTHQKMVHDILVKIQSDELLRCLLNISIYLGTLQRPEQIAAEFQRLTQNFWTQNKNPSSYLPNYQTRVPIGPPIYNQSPVITSNVMIFFDKRK